METPQDYGLPAHHKEWRKNQYESVQYCLGDEDVKVLAAPVGSGKSAIAGALGREGNVISLVRTRSLQATVYSEHNFSILFGRKSYPCTHPYSEEGDTAETCMFDEDMERCSESSYCPYLTAKEMAKHSRRASLTYAYYLTSRWPRATHIPTYLVADECHLCSDIVLDWVGCHITHREIRDWGFTAPPEVTYSEGMSLFAQVDPCDVAISWLSLCLNTLKRKVANLKKHLDSKYNGGEVKKKYTQGLRLQLNLSACLGAIRIAPNDWYIKSGHNALTNRSGQPEPGFLAKPLTARYHFTKLFKNSPYTILMSGTIGNPDTFATELGLKTYAYRAVPSNFPPSTRPIRVLDVPHLNYKSGEKEYNQQADAIAQAILGCPKEWSGVIHVTRKREAPLLADRLAHRGLQDRVWVTPELPTEQQMSAWAEHKAKMKGYGGQLAIAWGWVEGVDLVDERICINAKTPWPDTSDPYEKARQSYDNCFYSQRTAWALTQSLGRTRRGSPEDYDTAEEVRQLVAVADGSWVRLKKYLDPDFLESIVES